MILPLWDENPFEKPKLPWVSWSLIGINIALYAYSGGLSDAANEAFLRQFGLVPTVFLHDFSSHNLLPALNLLSAMFLHMGGMHIAGNMLFLWIFADDIEEALGRVRFIAFYLLSGILSGLVYIAASANSSLPEVGASGAIAGVLAAYLMCRPCKKILTLIGWWAVRIDAYWMIGVWVLLQVFGAIQPDEDSVAYAAHFGGLLAGATLFLLMRPYDLELFQCFQPSNTTNSTS